MKRLTTTVIERTRLSSGESIWLTDDIERGLRVRLSLGKTGSRNAVFYYRYRDRTTKKLVNTKIGTYGVEGLSLEDARKRTQELRTAVEQGISAKRYIQSQREEHALGEASEINSLRALAVSFSQYLDTTTLSEATKTTYRRYLRAIANAWPDQSPDDITPDDCETLFNQIYKKGVPPLDLEGNGIKRMVKTRTGGHRAAGHLLATGSRMWERMKRQRVATINPWSRMKELRERSESRISDFHLDEQGIKDFLQRAPEILPEREYKASLLMLATGLRPTEVLAATWTEIDLKIREWLIPANRMKYKKADHLIFVSDFAYKILLSLQAQPSSGFLFPSHGGNIPHLTTDHLGNVLDRLEIEGLSPKGFRATVRTGLQRLGCPEEVRSRISHHQRLDRVARSYDQYTFDDEARDWWRKWGEYLTGVID